MTDLVGEPKPRLVVAGALVVAAVLIRTAFFLAFDESYFDSDQAIVGLMAKHLVEGRAYPLFFYGQEYMLGVEAWLMAPVFAVLGPTVFALRVTMVLLNVAAALVLWWLLRTGARLNAWTALLAASPFVLAPFVTSAHLVEAQGGNVEPFLWVLIAWMLRARPLALGAALAVAFLHREFSIYAAPALLVAQLVEGGVRVRALVRPWVLTAFAFVVVFQSIQSLKPYADLMGPGSAGQPVSLAPRDNVSLLLERVRVTPEAVPGRFRALGTEHVPMILGLDGFRPYLLSIGSDAHVGWRELLPVVAGLAAILVAWLLVDLVRRRDWSAAAFPVFLAVVALESGIVYGLTRDPTVFTFRYGLLVLLLPVAIAALALQSGRPVGLVAVALALVGLLAAASLVDHATVLQRSTFAPPPERFGPLAARLEARGVRLARAGYWRAYAVSFLTGERVKVASTELQRVREYQVLADQADGVVVTIQETPCDNRTPFDVVGPWHLCK